MTALADPALRRTKVCARCGETKRWSEFPPRTRWEDGTVRTVFSYCRPCQVKVCRKWQSGNGRERWLEYKKGWNRDRQSKEKQQVDRLPDVPVGPLRDWLNARFAEGLGQREAAALTGVPERSVTRILHESEERVSHEMADRLITGLGGVFCLVYDDEVVVA